MPLPFQPYVHCQTERIPTAILISGRGSNMMSLVEAAAAAADYPAKIVAVIANRPDAAGIAWAAARGIPTRIIDHKAFTGREAFEAELHQALVASGAKLVCLAGFMRVLTASFVDKWRGRLINIHPSLLPSFKGLHTHEQVLEAGVQITGCTVHFVVPEMDAGPIIAQAAVRVLVEDTAETLAARVLAAEHKLYPQALRWVAMADVQLRQGASGAMRSRYLDVNQPDFLFSPGLPDIV